MNNLKINGVIGGAFSRFTVDGTPGYFLSRTQNMFTRVTHHVPGLNYNRLVCSVSNGVYGCERFPTKVNQMKRQQIIERLNRYISDFHANAVGVQS